MKTLNCNFCITISSNMRHPLKRTASLGIHIGAALLISVAPLNAALHRQLGISRVIYAQNSHVRMTGSWNRTVNFCFSIASYQPLSYQRSLESTFSTLAVVPAVICRILQTPVILGNISRILLIFIMFKDSYPLTMFTQLTFIFFLQFTNYGCLPS